MPDEPTPDQQDNPGQQGGTEPTATELAKQVEDWKTRYQGSSRKIEELMTSNRELQAQLEGQSSEIEQLKAELSLKGKEKDVAVGERDKQLEQALQKTAELEGQLKKLTALQLKVEIANKLGRPELLKIIQHIPDLEDAEALEVVMKDFSSFVSDAVKQREEQLMSGVTPGLGGPKTDPAAPSSMEEWKSHIASLSGAERDKAFNDYGDWLEANHR